MDIADEESHLLLDVLVPSQQPVVTHDGRHGDEQSDGGHDQCLADGTGNMLQVFLAGKGNSERESPL